MLKSLTKNSYQSYEDMVFRLLAEKNITNYSALAFQGGLGRNKFDDYSDIDLLIVFNNYEDSKQAIIGEHFYEGIKWSIFHLSLSNVDPKKWSDKIRYVYAYETKIIFDPINSLRDLCKESKLDINEQQERTIYKIKKMGNRGITYKGIQNEFWRGLKWEDSYDLWINRGDIFTANARINQSQELLIDLIYYINGIPVPSSKWKHNIVNSLPWIPKDFQEKIMCLFQIIDYSNNTFERRYSIITQLLTECIEEAINRELLPDDIGEYYFSKFSSHEDSNSFN